MNGSTEPPFLTFLRAGLERGSFETDDALAALLPLMRQTLAAHERGTVARQFEANIKAPRFVDMRG